ncbi:MAG: hypothetical protein WDO74_30850 [Pseudomonadota bacterium]
MSSTERIAGDSTGSATGLVVRNTLYLTAAQVVMIPLSVVINALTARYLGPANSDSSTSLGR